ncbi:MAG TPA: hypothetical protein VLI72_14190 [Methylibium sp.]|nr:hypothetical protein [Methylibium sp.]
MNTLQRFVLRAPATGGLHEPGAGSAPTAVARAQVLPLRHAPRQLELPLLFAPAAAPRHNRLRTG